MVANPIANTSHPGRRWIWAAFLLVIPLGSLAFASWWLTEPLKPIEAKPPRGPVAAAPKPAPRPDEPPPWPAERLEGDAAKRLLLDTLLAVSVRLNALDDYTAIFRKQERIKGTLGPEQTLAMKVRQRPFAVYFKFISPTPGKEVVYAEGYHNNKLIAHSTGVSKWLVPRLAVPPDHPLALADTRHAITEAGLANLASRLIAFRRADLTDREAETILDRTTDEKGRPRLRSVHIHPHPAPNLPFARSELLYDPETRFPVQISNYEWNPPGEGGELPLVERYSYDDLHFNVDLTALDFDPANPAYSFHRY